MRIPGSVVSLPSPTAPPHPQSQSRPGPDAFPQLRPQPPTCPAPGPPAEEVSASPPARKKGERMRVKASRRGVPYQLPQGPRLLPGQTLNFLSLKNGGEPLPRSLKLGTSRFSMGGRRQDARKWHQGPRRPLPAPAPPPNPAHSPQSADEAIDGALGVQGDDVPDVEKAGHLAHDCGPPGTRGGEGAKGRAARLGAEDGDDRGGRRGAPPPASRTLRAAGTG